MSNDPNSKMQILLVLMPWTPRKSWVERVRKSHPSIEVITHECDMHETKVPSHISPAVWERVTMLLTWKCFPTPNVAPNLRYVQLSSAGCNHIMEVPLFNETNIKFCTSNGVHPPQIAEWVIATFLAFQHHIPQHLDNQRICKWVPSQSDEDTEDAVGLRMGILGYGAIGRQCARLGKALGMDVYAYNLRERPTLESKKDRSYTEEHLGDPDGIFPSQWFHGPDQLDKFLASDLDLLVIVTPLTTVTRNMITAKQFEIMSRKKTYVCNVGRGPIINTEDLMVALETEQIRGAALDVTDPEPLTEDHRLWKCKNLIITPHISGNSNHYNDRVLKIIQLNLKRMSEDQPLVNVVNKQLGY